MGKVFKALNKAMGDSGNRQAVHDEKPVVIEKTASQVEPLVETVVDTGQSTPDNGGDVSAWDEKLSTFADSSSAISESFRYLRTKILHPPSGKPLRRILVTSAMPEEGKTLISASLGVSLARGMDQHALLVDCDMRRPSMAGLFAVSEAEGLVNYLRDDLDVSKLIRKTGLRKLSVIPSGAKPLNPAELLDSDAVVKLFNELSSRYDDRFIIVDTPPMQVASETAVLAKHVDGIIIVVRWGGTGREQVKKVIENLDSKKIIGVVFNACESNFLSSKLSGYDSYAQYSAKSGY